MDFRTKLVTAGGIPRLVDRYLKVVSVVGVEGYCEVHHVLPSSMFPEHSSDKWNLVRLTGRRHYVAHLILSSAFPHSRGMALAVMFMKDTVHQGRFNSRVYESVRSRAVSLMSEAMKGEGNPSWGLFGSDNPRYGLKRTGEQTERITVGLQRHLGLIAEDPEYRETNRAKTAEALNHPEVRAKQSKSKMGEKNPNHGKDITNSLTTEQRAKQLAAIKAGQLKRMPWESARWSDDKDQYWSKADKISEMLKSENTKTEIFMALFGRKDVSVWNACSTLIDKLNAGWDPLQCEKWNARYKEHTC